MHVYSYIHVSIDIQICVCAFDMLWQEAHGCTHRSARQPGAHMVQHNGSSGIRIQVRKKLLELNHDLQSLLAGITNNTGDS